MTIQWFLTYAKPARGSLPTFEWTGDYLEMKYAVRAGLIIKEESDTVSFIVKKDEEIIVHWTKEAGYLVGFEIVREIQSELRF